MAPLNGIQRDVTRADAVVRRDGEDEAVADGGEGELGAGDGEVVEIGGAAEGKVGEGEIGAGSVGDDHCGRRRGLEESTGHGCDREDRRRAKKKNKRRGGEMEIGSYNSGSGLDFALSP